MLENVLASLREITYLLSADQRNHEGAEHWGRRLQVVTVPQTFGEDLSEIKLTTARTWSLLQTVSTQADKTLKGVDPQDTDGGNLQLSIENNRLILLCLKDLSHKWEIEGATVKPA